MFSIMRRKIGRKEWGKNGMPVCMMYTLCLWSSLGHLYEHWVLFWCKTRWAKSYALQQSEKQSFLKSSVQQHRHFLTSTALLRQQVYSYKLMKKYRKSLSFLMLVFRSLIVSFLAYWFWMYCRSVIYLSTVLRFWLISDEVSDDSIA